MKQNEPKNGWKEREIFDHNSVKSLNYSANKRKWLAMKKVTHIRSIDWPACKLDMIAGCTLSHIRKFWIHWPIKWEFHKARQWKGKVNRIFRDLFIFLIRINVYNFALRSIFSHSLFHSSYIFIFINAWVCVFVLLLLLFCSAFNVNVWCFSKTLTVTGTRCQSFIQQQTQSKLKHSCVGDMKFKLTTK